MEVTSVNIGLRKTITWKNRPVETGIFKQPVNEILLGKTDVEKDQVIDRKYHGGIDKACYLYPTDAYIFWKKKYPQLDWNWGMFGENMTVDGLDESAITIGSVYSIGPAEVEISQPRQPCFKLGVRFGTQQVLKEFIAAKRSGTYVRVLKPGVVCPGDKFTLIRKGPNITILDVFELLYGSRYNETLLSQALELPALAISAKKDLEKKVRQK